MRVKDFTKKVGSGVTPKGGAEVYQDHGVPLFRSQNVTNDGFLLDDIAYISEDIDESMSGTRVKPNDVLLNITGASIGRCYYTPSDFERGNVNQHVCIIRPTKKIIAPYLYYNLISDIGQRQIDLTQTGSNREGLTKENICNFEFEVPPLDIQRRIVSYLDSHILSIDKRVSLLATKRNHYLRLKTAFINRAVTQGLNPDVKMKDSGEEWIGYIPSHWNKHRLKDLSYMYSGLTGKSGEDFCCDDPNKTKPYIPFTNVLNNFAIDFSKFNQVVMDDKEKQNIVQENDLIFLMSSEDYESIAKSAVVIGNPGEVYLNSFCRGLHFTKIINSAFINYQLNSTKYRDALRFEARGFTRINIKIEKISSMFICLPPLDEQNAIVEYLNQITAKIDSIINNIDTQIKKYDLLKRALINEVITGQRAV